MSRIKSIIKKKINNEMLYNLAVLEDESYMANNIVVHNCNSYLSPNFRANKKNPEITGLVPFVGEKEEKSISLGE